jgi:hypothetical protein
MSGSGAHSLSHDVDQDQAGQGPIRNAEYGHTLLAIDQLQDRTWCDRKRVLAILADDGRGFISRPSDREGHRAKCRVQEAWCRFFECDRLHAVKQVRVTKAIGMRAGCALTLAFEEGVDLLA